MSLWRSGLSCESTLVASVNVVTSEPQTVERWPSPSLLVLPRRRSKVLRERRTARSLKFAYSSWSLATPFLTKVSASCPQALRQSSIHTQAASCFSVAACAAAFESGSMSRNSRSQRSTEKERSRRAGRPAILAACATRLPVSNSACCVAFSSDCEVRDMMLIKTSRRQVKTSRRQSDSLSLGCPMAKPSQALSKAPTASSIS